MSTPWKLILKTKTALREQQGLTLQVHFSSFEEVGPEDVVAPRENKCFYFGIHSCILLLTTVASAQTLSCFSRAETALCAVEDEACSQDDAGTRPRLASFIDLITSGSFFPLSSLLESLWDQPLETSYLHSSLSCLLTLPKINCKKIQVLFFFPFLP